MRCVPEGRFVVYLKWLQGESKPSEPARTADALPARATAE